jgi:hypothetical protein
MRIVVSHLTRMEAPRICVAGLDPRTGRHIRPTTGASHPLTRRLLSDHGGPFSIGALVELGEVAAKPDPPETEDNLFWPHRAKALGRLSSDRYLELLRGHAAHSLRAIFGEELQRNNWSYAVEQGSGAASLGILRVQRRTDIALDRYGKLRLRLPQPGKPAYLPVTDLRFFEADHTTIRTDVVADVSKRMTRGVETFLMLGLSRAFEKQGDNRPRHWLQVNGTCLADSPLGDLP